MVDFLKNIAEEFAYDFVYGKNHWQNLKDYELNYGLLWNERKKHFHLITVNEDHNFNDYNATDSIRYQISFVLSVRSKMTDESYEFKHEHNIKGLKLEVEKIKEKFNSCGSLRINSWRSVEVEDLFDANLDGLKIDLTVTDTQTDLDFQDFSYQFYLISWERRLKEENAIIEAKECLTELYKFLNQE